MERPKDRIHRTVEYTCPRCQKTMMLTAVGNRKVCPACREEVRKEQYAAWNAQKAAERAQSGEKPEKVSQPAKPKKQPTELTVDERTALQIKLQCKKCDWYRGGESGVNPCCTYYLRHGVHHRVDPGKGPGDCRMFSPKGERKQKTKIKENENLLAKIEADYQGSKPRKEDYANEAR